MRIRCRVGLVGRLGIGGMRSWARIFRMGELELLASYSDGRGGMR